MKNITLEYLSDALKQTLGVEMAQKTILQAAKTCNMGEKSEYTSDEALKICEELKKNGGYVETIATILSTRILVASMRDELK